jgi:heavy metal translocating P-type ATPase
MLGYTRRSGEAFQTFKDVKKIVFDKTGTITIGRPIVARVESVSGVSSEELLRIAASLEKHSDHPLAMAIVQAAGEDIYQVDNFREMPGLGVEAVMNGERLIVANSRFLDTSKIDIAPVRERLKEMEAEGMTVSMVVRNSAVLGLIGISDKVKADARETINALRQMGLTPVLITGDNERSARKAASEAGIDEVFAEVLPHEKALKVREIQSSNIRVAMVGDGINDAPALMQADIGIAINAGTDIAIESADVILIRNELKGVFSAYNLSIKTYRKVKQNLFWAFLFNGIGIPVATTGILHPLMAMSAMVLSTTAIMINSFGMRFSAIKERADEAMGEYSSLYLDVPGIHCQSCIRHIEQGLAAIKGIKAVAGDPVRKRLTIYYDRGRTGEDVIRRAIGELGYAIKG